MYGWNSARVRKHQPEATWMSCTPRPCQSFPSSSRTRRRVSLDRSSSNSFFSSDSATGSWRDSSTVSSTVLTRVRSKSGFSIFTVASVDGREMAGFQFHVDGRVGCLLGQLDQAFARELQQGEERDHEDGNALRRIEQLGEFDVVRVLERAQHP